MVQSFKAEYQCSYRLNVENLKIGVQKQATSSHLIFPDIDITLREIINTVGESVHECTSLISDGLIKNKNATSKLLNKRSRGYAFYDLSD